MKKTILILVILSLIFVIGCSPYGQTQKTVDEKQSVSSSNEIIIKDFAFSPQTLGIKAGASVKWANKDSAQHSVDFNDFKSNQLSNGDSYEHIFDTAGEYDYICSIHPSMKGHISVK